MQKGGYVYIVSNKKRTVLYIGVTANLAMRIAQHKCGSGSVFTRRYRCYDLIYFEKFDTIVDAITREKQLKNWKREWKLDLIREMNEKLEDLSIDF